MPTRRLPVRPNLDQLHHQAKDLLKALHAGDPDTIAELREHHPKTIDPATARLADAQLVLARGYGASSWMRLVQAVELAGAIWGDDLDRVRQLISQNPSLLHEHVLLRTDSNWGPPMSYAATAGRAAIVRYFHAQGAKDLERAVGRAALAGHTTIVHLLYDLAGRPPMERLTLAGPAYTLNVEGTAALLALGARPVGPNGVDHNTMEHLLGTDSRNPAAKHQILELFVAHGFEPRDTPVMALHRGRTDLLAAHLDRDPDLLTRTFDITEIFPDAPACSRDTSAAQGTPVHGTTLLHLAVHFDELEIGRWLLDRGADPNVRAAIDAAGCGGFTPLFSTVVSQHNFWVNHQKGRVDDASFTKLLLDRGAAPNVRASIRHRLEPGHGGGPVRDYRDVTPLGWGDTFVDKIFVSRESMRLIESRGGVR